MNKRDNMEREVNGVKQSLEILHGIEKDEEEKQTKERDLRLKERGDNEIYFDTQVQGTDRYTNLLLMIHSELATMNEKLDDLYNK